MKHLKKFESSKDYLSYEEIRDFFQEFIDDNDFSYIKNHRPTTQSEKLSGFYDIEFQKGFNQDMCEYSSEEGCAGYSSPSLILNKISFIKDLDDIKKRLESIDYIFNFDVSMSADAFAFTVRIFCMGCHRDNIGLEPDVNKRIDDPGLYLN